MDTLNIECGGDRPREHAEDLRSILGSTGWSGTSWLEEGWFSSARTSEGFSFVRFPNSPMGPFIRRRQVAAGTKDSLADFDWVGHVQDEHSAANAPGGSAASNDDRRSQAHNSCRRVNRQLP